MSVGWLFVGLGLTVVLRRVAMAMLWLLTVLTVSGLLVKIIAGRAAPQFSATGTALWYAVSVLALVGLRRVLASAELALRRRVGAHRARHGS